jgi:hypothetical protein
MQSPHPRSFSFDHLRPIKLISEQVWRALRANGTFNRPEDPETAHGKITHRVMRYEIGRQVMSYAENGQMTDKEISQAIVKGISFTYSTLRGPVPFRKLSEALYETSAKTPTVVRKK